MEEHRLIQRVITFFSLSLSLSLPLPSRCPIELSQTGDTSRWFLSMYLFVFVHIRQPTPSSSIQRGANDHIQSTFDNNKKHDDEMGEREREKEHYSLSNLY